MPTTAPTLIAFDASLRPNLSAVDEDFRFASMDASEIALRLNFPAASTLELEI